MRLRSLRIDWRTLAKLLKIVDNDERTAGETAFDHPVVAVLRAEFYVVHVDRVVRCYGVNLLLTLKFSDCDLRYKNRAAAEFLFRL